MKVFNNGTDCLLPWLNEKHEEAEVVNDDETSSNSLAGSDCEQGDASTVVKLQNAIKLNGGGLDMSSSRIDKHALFEQARKNICSSRCNGLLLKSFLQIVSYGKFLQQKGSTESHACNISVASKD
ncbi:hypothetical protein YC2023_102437 [Brassica napus]